MKLQAHDPKQEDYFAQVRDKIGVPLLFPGFLHLFGEIKQK
jgi:hypothetical protein